MTSRYTPQYQPHSEPVTPIQVLNEAGELVDGAEPSLTDDEALEALRYMMLGRAFDTKSFSLQRQGKLGTFAPLHGQEASIMGSAMALDPSQDWVAPQYRELPALLRQGYPAERVALYREGHPEGGFVPPGVNILQYQISLAAQIPHAVGLAWGLKLQGKTGVSLVYFGDGASSEGDFHEACNLAGVVSAPVIFLLQNNQWAISTPRSIQSNATDLAARAPGYGFPGVSVDGNDLLAVHKVTADAVARARAGEGPTLIECHTYRMWAHTTADDPTRYVNPEEKEPWAARDPIERIQKYLASRGKWSDTLANTWDTELAEEVETAFAKAAEYPRAQAGEIYEHVYAESTSTLDRQKRWHLDNA
ncbi:MAG: pyruvate dehydrogenase (acetyl-transferring) E1 component subunit alpha [Gammaproteobacteria bacterium]|nr:pyruvate dehydrogenase (acetyl-transferring) E1 component subunit alpha [Gammaproteobacteria bacterium]